jgi:L-iditol 2-dehydrogenase
MVEKILIMRSMKILRLHGIGDLRLHDEPIPVEKDGEKLVRIGAVGICGSDLHWFSEGSIGDAKLIHPLALGHELAGKTEDGQPVAIDPAIKSHAGIANLAKLDIPTCATM